MNILNKLLSNGFLLFVPILIWNLILTKYLPKSYDPRTFDNGIPQFLLIGENIFRTVIFLLPLFVKISITGGSEKIGFLIFVIGVLIYFTSWLFLIIAPESGWSKSAIGFTAPAWTIIVWLYGFALVINSYYFNVIYNKWHYLVPSILMMVFHTTHSYLVYLKNVK